MGKAVCWMLLLPAYEEEHLTQNRIKKPVRGGTGVQIRDISLCNSYFIRASLRMIVK